jgi:hypothetical protein
VGTETRSGRVALQCVATFALLPWPAAQAADLTVIASEPLSLPWPPEAATGGGEFLVELDGYDITSVAEINSERLSLPMPALALEPGKHELRVTRNDANGPVVLLEQTLDVFQRPGVRRTTRQWNVLLSSAWQVDEHPRVDDADRSQADATLQWGSEYERASWRAQDSLNALYSANPAAGTAAWQLPGYELLLERNLGTARLGLALGDDALPLDNLLFSGFSRRGLRAQLSALEDRVRMQAFTLHTDPVTQADVDVVPLDEGTSMVGGFASFAALPGHPELLVFSAGWVDGNGTNGGAGVATPEGALTTGGSAWNAALDSYAWQRTLWLHGEYARSDFDADGSGVRGGDDATSAALRLSSEGGHGLAVFDQWSVEFEHRRIGAQFFALSNLALPGDLAARRVQAALGRRGLILQANALTQRSDVDDAPLHPRIETRTRGAALQYAPMWASAAAAPWRWIGTPSFSMSYERTRNAQRDGDAPALGFDVNNVQRAFVSNLQFAGSAFSFGIDFSRLERDDLSQPIVADGFTIYLPAEDTREHSLGVNASWRPNERFSISPQWQSVRGREPGSGARTRNEVWSVQLAATLIPQVLSVQTSWSDARDSQASPVPFADNGRTRNSGGTFDLVFRPPVAAHALLPQLDCHLRASYADRRASFAAQPSTDREWQISLGFDFTWTRGN